MTITIPSGQPNNRFMRYVRPPLKESENIRPLFPLRPATRPLRLGIDVTTVPSPPNGYLARFLRRDEIEVQLLVPDGAEVPSAWADVLHEPVVRQIGFASVESAARELDTVVFGVKTESAQQRSATRVHFFDVYQQLDAQTAPANADPLSLDQRHHAAAYAAAAGAVGIDAVVTNAPTAGRSDVADNDLVASVTPDDAVALIGHYLRTTANPIVNLQRGSLVGGGSWETTESTATIANFYDWGVVSAMPYFDVFPTIASRQGDVETVTALKSIRVRLARAARALDHMLAALSNPATAKQGPDVVETAAEAFDRELLYLAAAFDIYGRRYPLLIDSTRDPSKFRQSLDGRGYLTDHLNKEYDAAVLADVARLHVYAGVCKVLRNHIHDGILPVDQHPGRHYGSLVNIALNLDVMPELAPGANNGMDQEHFDALGTWTTEPIKPWDTPVTVADLATAGFTLMGAGLALVEAFTKLILRNKPKSASAPSPLLGCVQARPGETEPPPPERAVFHQALFGWHPA
ncbi:MULTISPECIES: hypothetical protein [Mycobacterium]|uniref:hypothetical protein n=1 Tax=Mycobacterium TaxID=1763 RepID=UPI00197BCDB2|nr:MULTISPECIES: hypothetical protein [Mycobacterium]MDM4138787.1 hypothetical protein [Mycobacterium sp. FLAC0960]